MTAPWFWDRRLQPEDGPPDGWAGMVTEWEGTESAVAYRFRADAALAVLTGLTNPGGHVITGNGCAAGVLKEIAAAGRTVSVVPATESDAIIAEVRDATQIVFLPSVAEPSMRLVPVNDIGAVAHGENLILVVDNSVLTPALFRPLDSGAHVVIDDWTEHDTPVCTVAGSRRLLRLVPPGESNVTLPADLLDRIRLRTAAASDVAAALSGHRMVKRIKRPDFAQHPWARETHEGFGPVLVLTCTADPARIAAALAGTGVVAAPHPLDPSALRILVGSANPERITAAVTTALEHVRQDLRT